jgi:amino acid transporter
MSSTLSSNAPGAKAGSAQIGMVAAVCIGIGGMVGAGIFSILGVVAEASGNAMWLAFAIGGVVALLSTYSYAKLGATFPSAGGAVHFLVKSFGDGVLAGGLNRSCGRATLFRSPSTPPPSAATRRPS